ncbi:contact-dependent growth inhibition system immunity protein [Streptomyces sp. NPDC056500]|uniref:contact-dependent growth inhibition system immunity protein n=1 Tax=Streptomyces sp. NPDC056500 TaxID=3345840 RepID=UPI0036AFA51F
MPMKPLDFDSRYGELDVVIAAYIGEPADDTSDKASRALQAYLRHTWRTRPWSLAIAEQQIRTYARNPPGRVRQRLGEFYPVPDIGLPDSGIQAWLLHIAGHIRRSVEQGEAPFPSPSPLTHWEWHARFPELAQLLGGWLSQDMPDEFVDLDAAIRDYVSTADHTVVARVIGEVHELLSLGLEDADYALAVSELGLEVDPFTSATPRGWLAWVAERLVEFGSGYGQPDVGG